MEELPRPAPARSVGDRVTGWVDWFGIARLVASAAAVVIVCVGAFWLTKAPRPATEAALPRTTIGEVVDSIGVTLPPPSTVPSGAGGSVTVHVTGAVARPGVYELPAGSRVHTAVELAGGAIADGDPDAINLAAIVGDGARIYIPLVGEEVPAEAAVGVDPARPGPVDINRASIAELDDLPGVGPATAAAIVIERERNGPFLNIDDLARVPGIGPVKLDGLRELVTT